MAKTVIGLYNNVERARNAVQDLLNHGFRKEDVSVMGRTEGEAQALLNEDMEHIRVIKPTGTDHEAEAENVSAGAGIGAALGGIGGFLVGAGLLFIPGIGPILAAGPLVGALTGAVIGAGVGALVGALVNLGVPEEEAGYYAEGVRRGGTLVAVAAPEDRVEEVSDILAHHSPVDIRAQVDTWRKSGWKGYDPKAKPLTPEELERERALFPLDEQHVLANEEDMESGVRTAARSETVRRAEPVGVREARERVRPWEEYETEFRSDFERRWKGTSATWDEYEPAYRYAYDVASEPRYQDTDWDEVEDDLRKDWEDLHDDPWDDVRDAVRQAWMRIRSY